MKIATYNVWDSDTGMPVRFHKPTEEIIGITADINCLQEVPDVEKHHSFSTICRYERNESFGYAEFSPKPAPGCS